VSCVSGVFCICAGAGIVDSIVHARVFLQGRSGKARGGAIAFNTNVERRSIRRAGLGVVRFSVLFSEKR